MCLFLWLIFGLIAIFILASLSQYIAIGFIEVRPTFVANFSSQAASLAAVENPIYSASVEKGQRTIAFLIARRLESFQV
jgi:hypothetical protein